MIDEVLKQLQEYGLIVDHVQIGKLMRVDVEGDRPRSFNGWYSLFDFTLGNGKQIITGAYGSWKRADTQKVWTKGLGIDPAERRVINARIAENKRIAEQARIEAAAAAARTARRYWERTALRAGEAPYLARKGVGAYGVRYSAQGAVVVPLMNVHGAIMGLQFINAEKSERGDKFFWPRGVSVTGCHFVIGTVVRGKPIAFAEGYATAASVYEAKGWPVVVCFNSGNLLPCAKALRGVYPDSPFIICADDDWKSVDGKGLPYNSGMIEGQKTALAVDGRLVKPSFRARQGDQVDFNDLHAAEGLDAVRHCFQEVDEALNNWRQRLAKASSGGLLEDMRNVYMILANDVRWQGVLTFCNLSYRVIKSNKPPFPESAVDHVDGEWRADDTNRTMVWLAEHYGMSPRDSTVDKAVDMVAQDHAVHPVKHYLHSITWDGVKRIDRWLEQYLGVKPSLYTCLVGRKWLLGAVARVMRYPVKVDNLLILEGAQGLGKSTVFKILGGQWYADTHFTLGEKDGYEQMQGVWICELSELDSFGRAESSRAKGFFSSETDRFRPSYGRRAENFPRQCVFGGTTNQDAYFKDATGNRRYWPVLCENIRLELLARDRDQLWAEAFIEFTRGGIWHVEESEAHLFEHEQEQRLVSDSWETIIQEWLDDAGQIATKHFTQAEIFFGALRMDAAQMKPPEQHRIGQIMTRLEWRKVRRPMHEASPRSPRVWKYERPSTLGE